MPEIKTPSAGNAVIMYFVSKLERVDKRAGWLGGGYVSEGSFFPDSFVKAFDSENNSLTFTPDFFGKHDDFVIMRFGNLTLLVDGKSISKILIV